MTSVSAQYLVIQSPTIPYCHTLTFRVTILSTIMSNDKDPILQQIHWKRNKKAGGNRIVVLKGENCVEPWSNKSLSG